MNDRSIDSLVNCEVLEQQEDGENIMMSILPFHEDLNLDLFRH